jgi:hypothetical protein
MEKAISMEYVIDERVKNFRFEFGVKALTTSFFKVNDPPCSINKLEYLE